MFSGFHTPCFHNSSISHLDLLSFLLWFSPHSSNFFPSLVFCFSFSLLPAQIDLWFWLLVWHLIAVWISVVSCGYFPSGNFLSFPFFAPLSCSCCKALVGGQAPWKVIKPSALVFHTLSGGFRIFQSGWAACCLQGTKGFTCILHTFLTTLSNGTGIFTIFSKFFISMETAVPTLWLSIFPVIQKSRPRDGVGCVCPYENGAGSAILYSCTLPQSSLLLCQACCCSVLSGVSFVRAIHSKSWMSLFTLLGSSTWQHHTSLFFIP